MRIRELLAEIHRRDRVLALTGWWHAALLAAMLILAPFDSRTVMGLNPWIKPIKFAASITIYVWTIAWLLPHLPGPAKMLRFISRGIAIAMVIEIACIALQAARGTTSHYNVATAFDGLVFSLMGLMILFNTLLAASLLVLFFTQKTNLPPAHLWGIRLGLLIFVMGSLEGAVMIAGQAHTVGLADGGPGLPFVNWSTRAGDLRVAHMLGLHALQIFPLAGWVLQRRHQQQRLDNPLAYLLAFVTLYVGALGLVFWQALQGRPLLAL